MPFQINFGKSTAVLEKDIFRQIPSKPGVHRMATPSSIFRSVVPKTPITVRQLAINTPHQFFRISFGHPVFYGYDFHQHR
jgi:hypothetical protein